MRTMVDIEVVLDEKYRDPKVNILTSEKTELVENIIEAVENVSESGFLPILGQKGDDTELVSQRDVIRAYTDGRKIMLHTENGLYSVNKSLTAMEGILNPKRFIRISQSEIVNLYKVKCFDVNSAGTIGIEFYNGTKSWASRSRVKAVKDLLKEYL